MIYKIQFDNSIEYEKVLAVSEVIGPYTHDLTGLTSIEFKGSVIVLLLDGSGEITGLEIANECTRTHDIENKLIQLTAELLNGDTNEVELIDGDGFAEVMDSSEFIDNYADDSF